MCLLTVLHRVHPEWRLVIAANRDEMLDRPATAMTVLQAESPRILGGRDELAGGTWMAINEHGLVAGLTNKPTPATGRDASKRSRGELPLLLAHYETAADAVANFVDHVDARDYNPCWLLVGDGETLHYIDVTGQGAAQARELEPGIHVLENRPLDAPSPKVRWVTHAVRDASTWTGDALVERLAQMLRSHEVPDGAGALEDVDGFARPESTEAACVHAGPYGTRSASIIRVDDGLPRIASAAGRPCENDFEDVSALWDAS